MGTRRSYYYDINKKYLMLIGQWPYQKPKEKLFYFTFIITLAFSSIVPQGAKFGVCETAQCIYETLPPYMLAMMVLWKIFTYHFNSEKIKDLTDHLFVDWDILETKEEHDIMRKYAEKGRWYALIYGCKFVQFLESTFTISLAVQLLLVTIGLSITLVQFSIQLHDLAEATRYFVFIFAQLFHLFCFSFQGQKVIDYSLEICDKIYHSSWYTIPVKEQRLLMFVLRKSIEASVLSAGKIYIFSLESFTTIKSLTDQLCDDWKKLNSAEEYEIMKKYATNARLITVVYLIYIFFCSWLFTLISFMPKLLNIILSLNESLPISMPYKAYYFVDEEKYYFYILFHIFVFTSIAIMAEVAHDCTFFIYIEHVCSLFAVAGFRLETVSLNDRNNANNRLDRKIYNRKIAISIHAHWRAIRFAEILEDIFCIAFAVQMLIVTITLSITLLQVALLQGEINETFKYLAFIFAQVIHTFCFSIQGQRLIDHSSQLSDKIYNSSWYEIPAELRRLLLFVMRRSMQPSFLNAGKIYVFSLKSFTTVNII
ncbi:PREDICTED: uncharacterized protein LOC108770896 [Trachymyrmex cornetzi]|uniref:uncharacterized protein LOC108770896 n=1 Tax=Trachymyrmex cornetzi TaxID=471704 RepID=UPI00084EF977|nr:PREDICTED: uncharacterized protein LOC108770896 [Trachymyrmex cornetzi]